MFCYKFFLNQIIFILISIFLISCAKLETKKVLTGNPGQLNQPLIFCGNGTEYTFTGALFFSTKLVVRGAHPTGKSCVAPAPLSPASVSPDAVNYYVCINEIEYLASKPYVIGYRSRFLYAMGLSATGRYCDPIFQSGFAKD